jgi:hypothetical protein
MKMTIATAAKKLANRGAELLRPVEWRPGDTETIWYVRVAGKIVPMSAREIAELCR